VATPQPSTPGDRRENYAQQVAAALGAAVAQAELVVIATVATLAKRVTSGLMPLTIAQRRLARTGRTVLVGTMQRILPASGTPDQLGPSFEAAAEHAITAAQEALTVAAEGPEDGTVPASAASAISPYRQAVDRAIASSRGGLPASSLSLSRVQAAQKALDDLAAQGLTGFVDKAGRRWDLATYVEMATRTAVSNAWDEHQAAALTRAGVDLVLVSTHSTEGSCPQCLPWLGRTLSLTGSTPEYPTLADAKAAGFRHPNCRCSWAPVGVDMAEEVTNPADVERAAAVYRASQRQRALERRVREAHRRVAAAVTPAARAKARRELAAARAASEQHRERHGLVMTQASVRRRQHPFQAR
jgi:Phage minor capsid protein 2